MAGRLSIFTDSFALVRLGTQLLNITRRGGHSVRHSIQLQERCIRWVGSHAVPLGADR
jgi:hypothetical protein